MKTQLANENFGHLVAVGIGSNQIIGRIASEVSQHQIIGIDLMDSCPVTLLAKVSDIELYVHEQLKDTKAFEQRSGVCYIPESCEEVYCYNDYIQIARGNPKLARILFDLSDWQHPETIFEELLMEEEIDCKGNVLIN